MMLVVEATTGKPLSAVTEGSLQSVTAPCAEGECQSLVLATCALMAVNAAQEQ